MSTCTPRVQVPRVELEKVSIEKFNPLVLQGDRVLFTQPATATRVDITVPRVKFTSNLTTGEELRKIIQKQEKSHSKLMNMIENICDRMAKKDFKQKGKFPKQIPRV